MSEEITTMQEKLCHKHFWMCTFAVFLGVYLALSVFAFTHKPQYPPMMPQQPSPYMFQNHYMGPCPCPCHQKMMFKKFLKQHMDFLEDARKLQEDN